MLLDPTEPRGDRITRRVVWTLVAAIGVGIWRGYDPNGPWDSLGFVVALVGGGFLVKSVFFDPIENQIRELDRKIDEIDRRLGGN